MRLRQVALAASDLASTVETLTDVLGIEVAYRDPGVGVFGLVNAVMPIGETQLEVVSPVRDDATARRWIEKRGGDAGYMVILQCDDHAALEAEAARAQQAGAKVVWQGEHEGARTVHLHPRELGAILSFDAIPAWPPAFRSGDSLIGQRVFLVISSDRAERDPRQLLLALHYLLQPRPLAASVVLQPALLAACVAISRTSRSAHFAPAFNLNPPRRHAGALCRAADSSGDVGEGMVGE